VDDLLKREIIISSTQHRFSLLGYFDIRRRSNMGVGILKWRDIFKRRTI